MELGFDFDDSDFTEKVREKPILTSYNAKVCYEKWYLDPAADNGKNDPATLYKFKADYYYHNQQWEKAIQCNNQVLGSLGSQNRTMRREVQESLIRCHIHTQQFTEAITGMQQLISDCVSIDHLSQALMLKQRLLEAAGSVKDELQVLHQLIYLHPLNAFFWNSLGKLYEKMKHKGVCELSDGNSATYNTSHSSYTADTQTSGKEMKCKNISKSQDKTNSEVNKGDLGNDNTLIAANTPEVGVTSPIDNAVSSCEIDMDSNKKDNRFNVSATSPNENVTTREVTSFEVTSHDVDKIRSEIEQRTITPTNVVFKSDTSSEEINMYPIDLVLLTCYVRTRLILMSVQMTVGTLIKQHNMELAQQISEKITSLPVSEEHIQQAEQFMRQDMFDDDKDDAPSVEQEVDIKTLVIEQLVREEEFNKKWFGWIHNNKTDKQ